MNKNLSFVYFSCLLFATILFLFTYLIVRYIEVESKERIVGANISYSSKALDESRTFPYISLLSKDISSHKRFFKETVEKFDSCTLFSISQTCICLFFKFFIFSFRRDWQFTSKIDVYKQKTTTWFVVMLVTCAFIGEIFMLSCLCIVYTTLF